jgi:hypothetical protein
MGWGLSTQIDRSVLADGCQSEKRGMDATAAFGPITEIIVGGPNRAPADKAAGPQCPVAADR